MNHFLKSLLGAFVTIFGVMTLSFALIHFIPGDPIEIMLGEQASAVDKESLRKELGLNQPLFQQYTNYLKKLIHLNLGRSVQTKRPVLNDILQRLPASMELGFSTLFFSLLIGVPFGIWSAIKKGTWISYALLFVAVLGLSMPAFWLGPLLIWVFSLEMNLLPINERGTWAHLILPSLTLSSGIIAIILRMTRTSMLNVLDEDFIRVAKAKGVSSFKIYCKHAFYNAVFPLLTISGLILGSLLTGTVIIETIFDWPGLGNLVFHAIQQRDYPLVQGCVLFISVIYVSVNFLTDFAYQFFNPKVKVSSGE